MKIFNAVKETTVGLALGFAIAMSAGQILDLGLFG